MGDLSQKKPQLVTTQTFPIGSPLSCGFIKHLRMQQMSPRAPIEADPL
jgi:hypothetical protein